MPWRPLIHATPLASDALLLAHGRESANNAKLKRAGVRLSFSRSKCSFAIAGNRFDGVRSLCKPAFERRRTKAELLAQTRAGTHRTSSALCSTRPAAGLCYRGSAVLRPILRPRSPQSFARFRSSTAAAHRADAQSATRKRCHESFPGRPRRVRAREHAVCPSV